MSFARFENRIIIFSGSSGKVSGYTAPVHDDFKTGNFTIKLYMKFDGSTDGGLYAIMNASSGSGSTSKLLLTRETGNQIWLYQQGIGKIIKFTNILPATSYLIDFGMRENTTVFLKINGTEQTMPKESQLIPENFAYHYIFGFLAFSPSLFYPPPAGIYKIQDGYFAGGTPYKDASKTTISAINELVHTIETDDGDIVKHALVAGAGLYSYSNNLYINNSAARAKCSAGFFKETISRPPVRDSFAGKILDYDEYYRNTIKNTLTGTRLPGDPRKDIASRRQELNRRRGVKQYGLK